MLAKFCVSMRARRVSWKCARATGCAREGWHQTKKYRILYWASLEPQIQEPRNQLFSLLERQGWASIEPQTQEPHRQGNHWPTSSRSILKWASCEPQNQEPTQLEDRKKYFATMPRNLAEGRSTLPHLRALQKRKRSPKASSPHNF